MNEKLYLDNGVQALVAEYIWSGIDEYDENPYIQALPRLDSNQSIVSKLFQEPLYRDEECLLDTSIRVHLVQRLYNLFQPLPTHIRIWNMISSLMRQGYLARNPFNREYIHFLHESGRAIINKQANYIQQSTFKTTASTGTLIGFSGMGKTTTVNKVLSHMPQVILHNQYKGTVFSQIQLTWLKLEAPHNASLKALCLQYFMKLDEILGTNNFKLYVSRNLSVDAMLPLMGQAGQNVGLGLLVIDEFQHFVGRHMNQTMSYFVTLINSFGIPVLFIGTPAAYPIFESELRLARRVTGTGEIIWNNMEKDEEFKLLLGRLWKYQWLKYRTELSDDLVDIFYEETQGITDLVIKLFINVQEEAIVSGKELICATLVRKVAKQRFRALKGMLEAIKSKNPYKVAKYEDIKRLEETCEDIKVRKITSIQTKREEDKEAVSTVVYNEKTKTHKRHTMTYEEGDIRSILNVSKQDVKMAYATLLEESFIDDMNRWVQRHD